MSWHEAVLWWLPTAAVAAMAALGILAVAVQPARPARKYWLAALIAAGLLATGASGWRQQAGRTAQSGQLREADAKTAALQAKVKDLGDQLRVVRAKAHDRTIDADSATKIADALRKAGNHRVVVSCAPDDVEAYQYANQIANMLRAAGWDALGPEATTIFGEAPAMGLRLYVRGGAAPPETAKILSDAFTRFNIPFESGLTPSAAIPDPATTEIFVSHKP